MIFRKWKIILFEIELISVYWMLSGERDFFFLKNWNDKNYLKKIKSFCFTS